MSDDRAAQLVDTAFECFTVHRAYLDGMVDRLPAAKDAALREFLRTEVFSLQMIEQRMREVLSPLTGQTPQREAGLTTDAWMAGVPGTLRRNRGLL